MRPPMLNHDFITDFRPYLHNRKKIIFISHILTDTVRFERNDKKSSIFGIKAKFRISQISSQMLKIAKNGISVYI